MYTYNENPVIFPEHVCLTEWQMQFIGSGRELLKNDPEFVERYEELWDLDQLHMIAEYWTDGIGAPAIIATYAAEGMVQSYYDEWRRSLLTLTDAELTHMIQNYIWVDEHKKTSKFYLFENGIHLNAAISMRAHLRYGNGGTIDIRMSNIVTNNKELS